MSIRHFVRNCIRRAGWDVRRFDPRSVEGAQLAWQLGIHHVDLILDVGANSGQFAKKLREAGFHGRIVSFEPSADAHASLIQNARGDTNWIIAPRMALGDRDGTIRLNLAGNSVSSSILPMLPSHGSAAPESRYVGSETVDLRKLDNISAEFARNAERVFLKLDVQGFEYQVLQGAEQFLRSVAGMQLELSLVPLYDGEHLFHSMLQHLEDRGFELWSLAPSFVDPSTSRLLQVDAIFFRKQ